MTIVCVCVMTAVYALVPRLGIVAMKTVSRVPPPTPVAASMGCYTPRARARFQAWVHVTCCALGVAGISGLGFAFPSVQTVLAYKVYVRVCARAFLLAESRSALLRRWSLTLPGLRRCSGRVHYLAHA
jgi:hypothetical protein